MGPSEATAGKRVFAGTTYLGMVLNFGMDPEEIAANAELWADAPRMLNALRALCECTVPDPEEDRDLTRRVFADAERLLEKHGG
jgi:hypothetical protein